jgi:hypothetical protein
MTRARAPPSPAVFPPGTTGPHTAGPKAGQRDRTTAARPIATRRRPPMRQHRRPLISVRGEGPAAHEENASLIVPQAPRPRKRDRSCCVHSMHAPRSRQWRAGRPGPETGHEHQGHEPRVGRLAAVGRRPAGAAGGRRLRRRRRPGLPQHRHLGPQGPPERAPGPARAGRAGRRRRAGDPARRRPPGRAPVPGHGRRSRAHPPTQRHPPNRMSAPTPCHPPRAAGVGQG